MALMVGASQGKSESCLVFCPRVLYKGSVRYLTCQKVMLIFGWVHLAVSHHLDKFDDQRHCASVEMFLVCHVTTCLRGYVNL